MEVTVNNITTTVEIEAGYDLFEVVITDLSDENIEKYAIEAAQSAADALASANLAEGYKVQTGLDRAATGADRIQTGLDAEQTGLDRIATGQDRLATAADRAQTGLDRIQTGLDAQATETDKVQTGLDRIATGEDRTQTGLDRIATGADRIQTGLDAAATAADLVQTGLDRVATGADRVQTGLDVIAANAIVSSIPTIALDSPITGYVLGTNTPLDSNQLLKVALGNIQGQINAREATITAGTTAQYYSGDKTFQDFQTAVRGTLLTGYVVGANTALLPTDSILLAFGKVQSQINNFTGGGITLNSPITGYVVGSNTALTDTDSILQAFGKAQGQINERQLIFLTATATLTTGSWSLVASLYEQSISNVNITSSSIVDVIPDNANITIVEAAQFLPRTDSFAGSVKVYAKNLPTANISVTINIWR